jgi:hypothetical protein
MVAYRKIVQDAGALTECARCGYDNSLVLEVHHKDRDRENNSIENLEVLCANCHKLEHDDDRRRKRGRTKPLTNQVNARYPKDLLARIDAAAGEGKRSEWILEACRMRLDGRVAELADAGDLKSSSLGSDGSSPSSATISANSSKAEQLTHNGQDVGSTPASRTKLDMQALRDICAGGVQVQEKSAGGAGAIEIPICGKTWWEDGEHYECLMDAGHREQKHGLRGMVRRLD